jgi:Amt family ammonium transporter
MALNNTELESLIDDVKASLGDYAQVSDMDIFWLIFGAVLVFLMQAGFALLEVGSVSKKNTKNILVKNMFDASVGAIGFYLVGFGFAQGDSSSTGGFIGTDMFLLKGGFVDDDAGTIEGGSYALWLFQFAFAATAATIVSGAVAERVQFTAYLIYAFVLVLWVYPVVVQWGWGGAGWASAWKDEPADKFMGVGVIDFAGSGVVHMVGGTAALFGAIFIGPRTGRFNKETGEPQELPQQSAAFQALGTLILWFGWYGFNSVSTLAIGGLAGVAAKTAVTTTLAAAAGCMTCLLLGKISDGVIDNGLANNGVLAGLVSITAGCSVVEPEAAVLIGVIGGVVYFYSSKLLLKFQIDDVVDAAPVHCFCGAWGVIAAGLFATETNYKLAYYEFSQEQIDDGYSQPCGLLYGCGANQFIANVIFVVAVFAWTALWSCVLFGGLNAAGKLRVSEEEELVGLDESHHGGLDGDYSKSSA